MPTLLILAASPLNQDRLRLGNEVKEIRNSLQRSKNRENWKIESNEAATVDDLRRALLDNEPTIVHFAGHGGPEGLCFESADGGTHVPTAVSLVKLLHHFRSHLKCIVLNSCFSEMQATLLQPEIDFIIGMRCSIDDASATRFSVAFYDAVFAGTTFRMAFDLGCSALDLHNLPDADVPIIRTGAAIGQSMLKYSWRIPQIETFLMAYLNAAPIDRAPFTTTGALLIPLLQRHYATKIMRTIDKVQVLGLEEMDADSFKVLARISSGGDSVNHEYYLRINERDIHIEWEATVGIWSMPVKTYLALGTDQEVVARVTAELDTYYNYWYGDKEDLFQSISLGTACGERLHGYIRRGTDEFRELVGILSDGNSHDVTLALVNHVDKTENPRIVRLLSKNWIFHRPVA